MQAEVPTNVFCLNLFEPTRHSELINMDLSSPGLVKLPDKGDRDVHPSQIIDGSLTQDEDGGLKNKVMNGSGLGSTLTNGISQKEDLNDPGKKSDLLLTLV